MSALSTVAIKDGHQGNAPAHHTHVRTNSSDSESSTNTLEAERADRISRLAGLERVATVRPNAGYHASGPTSGQVQPPPGYFNQAGLQHVKERSTVGSASATGSVGGRATWASESDINDADKMSEDQDDGVSSSAGLSDEGNASLVGFGEGASSTISGPVSNPGRSAGSNKAIGNAANSSARPSRDDNGSPMQGVEGEHAQMMDGMTYDRDVVDTTPEAAQRMAEDAGMTAQEQTERIMSERNQDARRNDSKDGS